MKKLISLLLAIIMVLALVGCGGSKDKEKLIGEWNWETTDSSNNKNELGYYIKIYNDIYISFFPDGTYSRKQYSEMYMSYDGVTYALMAPGDTYIYSGKYQIKDGIITTKSTDGKDEREYPYVINEYTKELIFNVDRNGNSEWRHRSDTPKNYEE